MSTAIVDGGWVNTEPELEFPEDIHRKLSPAEILDNLNSWVDSSIADDTYTGSRSAGHLEARMIRRDAFLDVKRWLKRLGTEEWV